MIRIILFVATVWLSSTAVAEEYNATLEWYKRIGLGMVQSGIVKTVSVKPGQHVEKGDLLIALDDRYLKARMARAEAGLVEAEHDRDEGARELERAIELYDRTVLSDHDLQVAQIGEARTKAVWRRAQAELAEARLALQQSRVTAPFAGVILGVDAYPGQALVNGLNVQTLVELADDKRLLAKTRVTAEQIGHLNKESSVQVDIAGRQVTAKVEYLALEPSLGVSTDIPLYDLKVIFNRPDDMVVRVGLPVVIRAE